MSLLDVDWFSWLLNIIYLPICKFYLPMQNTKVVDNKELTEL